MGNQVFVVAEHIKGGIEDITFEMLGKGREIANDSGGELIAIVLGNNARDLANELGTADKVIYADDTQLADFNPEAYGKVVSAVVEAHQPKIVIVANTSMGMDIAAGLSVEQQLPLIAYANDISSSGGSLSVVSQLYGGKMNVESEFEGESCIVSVIAGSFPVEAGKKEGSPAIEDFACPDLSSLSIRFVTLIEPEGEDVDITQQEVLVSVGRGIQNEENLPIVENLASKLGGAVSCSRPIVDNKWLSKTRQVGKSGLKVKPKLYLAIGISGAPEHIEGMKDAELIIAINADKNAPIFDFAHYGVVADLFDIVPALSDKL